MTRKCKAYADIRGVPQGASNDSGVVDDGNFLAMGGYFFGNVRYKTSNIT